MNSRLPNTSPNRRRGVVVVMVAVTLPVILGFAALTVDVGLIFSTRASLQNSADAAVLAAVQDLRGENALTAIDVARATAADFVSRNHIWKNKPATFDPITDMVFGVATLNDDSTQVVFTPGIPFNAVEITVRYEVDYTFAALFGLHSKVVSASALAGIRARDLMLVLDHSGSMDDDAIETSVCSDLEALGIFVCGGISPDDSADSGDWGNIPPASDDSDSSGGDDSD